MKLPRIPGVAFALTSVLAVALLAGCDSDEEQPTATATVAASPTSGTTISPTPADTPRVTATPTATTTAVPTATPTAAVPTATPGPPHLERFAAGEVIDVAPAVVFVDPATGEAEAWVIPGAERPEFAVAPDGSYIVYQVDGGFRLLRTDDGSDRAIETTSLTVELGPGGAGFVATTQDRFVVSAFDGRGEHLGELWLGGVSADSAVSWSGDGMAIAYAIYPRSGSTLEVSVRSVEDWSLDSFSAGTASGGVSLEWSHDSQRIAVVTDGHLRVFSRAGELLGEFEGALGGEFGGYWANPRWSPDGAYLYLNQMPRTGGELAYLFTAEAEPVFRFFTPSYAGGCGGDHWVDADTLEFGDYDVDLDGTFGLHGRAPLGFYQELESYGVVVADGLDIHRPHAGTRNGGGHTLDGRLVFSTPEVGHGGCGEAWRESSETEAVVERPPFEER